MSYRVVFTFFHNAYSPQRAKQMRTIRKTDVKVGKIKGYVRMANITSL